MIEWFLVGLLVGVLIMTPGFVRKVINFAKGMIKRKGKPVEL